MEVAVEVARLVAYNPRRNRVYCANELGNTLSVIDCSTNTVTATFPAPYSPAAVLSTLYGHTYVADNGGSWLLASAV